MASRERRGGVSPTRSSSPPAPRRGWTAPTSSRDDRRSAAARARRRRAGGGPRRRRHRGRDDARAAATRSWPAAGSAPTGRSSSTEATGARIPSAPGSAALERAVPDPDGDARRARPRRGAPARVRATLVADVVDATERHGAAIPVVPVSDTLKRIVDDRIEATVDRSAMAAAQTPQGVRRAHPPRRARERRRRRRHVDRRGRPAGGL